MIDSNIIADHPQGEVAVKALMDLALSGILIAQIESNNAALFKGSVNEEASKLAERILQTRQRNLFLESIHYLGEQLHKEYTNA